MKVLVAGATGAVGRHAVQQLLAAGHVVRALSHRPEPPAGPKSQEPLAGELTEPATLAGSCAGVDAVIACAGASLHIGAIRQRSGFLHVDLQGNRNLLAEARRSGVGRFIYVSEDIRAHERISEEVATSGIPSAMIRPTRLFSACARWLPWAHAGFVPLLGSGAERTNPIHEAEVARACVEALSGGAERRIIGGPEIFTRHRLAEMAFDALGKPPRLLVVPPALLEFGGSVTRTDVIAPSYGTLRLGDYLRALTAVMGSEPSFWRR